MKKSTIIYLLMFMCSFLLPAFTVVPSDTIKTDKSKAIRTSSDSVVVSLKFQNPTVEITDSRASGVLEKKFDSQATSTVELMNAVNLLAKDLGQAVVLQQEGRCESAMDRIKRLTGVPTYRIIEILDQQLSIQKWYVLVTLAYVALISIIYNTSFRRQRILVLLPTIMCTVLWLAVMLIITYLLPWLYGVEYMRFFQLIKLSP
jgi:hypothetical protein